MARKHSAQASSSHEHVSSVPFIKRRSRYLRLSGAARCSAEVEGRGSDLLVLAQLYQGDPGALCDSSGASVSLSVKWWLSRQTLG